MQRKPFLGRIDSLGFALFVIAWGGLLASLFIDAALV